MRRASLSERDDIIGIVQPEVAKELLKIEKLVEPDVFTEIKGDILRTEPEKRMRLLLEIEDNLHKADLCAIEPCDEFDEPMSQEEFDAWCKELAEKQKKGIR